MKIKDILNLIRVRQWYKNLIVFLAIFFSLNITTPDLLLLTLITALALSLTSSAGYIINDLKDLKQDRLHPEKKLRPLANKKISPTQAIILSLSLLAAGLILASTINTTVLLLTILLLILNLAYTFILKYILLADVLTIASLFVLRALAGAAAIQVKPSPWLFLVPFFLALFLAVGKRHADCLLLKNNAHKTRKVLKDYTTSLTQPIMIISTTSLILSYSLYSFSSEHNLLLTLPIALYVIFKYYTLIIQGSSIARHPEKVIKDKHLMIGILIWIITTILIIYL